MTSGSVPFHLSGIILPYHAAMDLLLLFFSRALSRMHDLLDRLQLVCHREVIESRHVLDATRHTARNLEVLCIIHPSETPNVLSDV